MGHKPPSTYLSFREKRGICFLQAIAEVVIRNEFRGQKQILPLRVGMTTTKVLFVSRKTHMHARVLLISQQTKKSPER